MIHPNLDLVAVAARSADPAAGGSNWLRIAAALILVGLLIWVLVDDYRFKREQHDDAGPAPHDWWGA